MTIGLAWLFCEARRGSYYKRTVVIYYFSLILTSIGVYVGCGCYLFYPWRNGTRLKTEKRNKILGFWHNWRVVRTQAVILSTEAQAMSILYFFIHSAHNKPPTTFLFYKCCRMNLCKMRMRWTTHYPTSEFRCRMIQGIKLQTAARPKITEVDHFRPCVVGSASTATCNVV